MKSYFKFIILVFLVVTFSSCLSEESASVGESVYGDVLIKAYRQGDSVVYNTQFYAYSYYEMKSVEAYAASDPDNMIELDTVDYKYTFAHIPDRSAFTTQKPSTEKYYFNVVFTNGESVVISDQLDSTTINPPKVTRLDWDEEESQAIIEWESVNNTYYYKLILKNAEGRNVFETELLDPSQTEKWINAYTYGWHTGKTPVNGELYTVVINAYLFEPIPSNFDVQCLAVNDQHSFTWTAAE